MNPDESQRWHWLAAAAGVGVLVWLLAPILTPFVISAMLGWLGDPLVDHLEKSGRSRGLSVALVFILMTLLLALALLVLLPMLWDQLQTLIDSLPGVAAWVSSSAVPWLEKRSHLKLAQYIDPGYLFELVRSHWDQAGGVAATVLGQLSRSGLALFEIIANIALVPVLTFYFLRDWDVLVGRIRALLPRSLLPAATRLAVESNDVLGGFIRGQLSVMVALGAIYAIGLWLVGLDLGLLIGFIAGMVAFVPYLGAFVGVSAAVIATLVQHGDAAHLMLVLMVFAVGQTLESFLLVPWLVGDRIGVHPVAVIFAIMAGGQLFGFLGVLLALPVAALAMVLLRYGHERYTSSDLYGAEVALPDSQVLELAPEGAPLADGPVIRPEA